MMTPVTFKRQLCDEIDRLSAGRLDSTFYFLNFSLDECWNEYVYLRCPA